MATSTNVERLTPKQIKLIRHLLTLVDENGVAQMSYRQIAEMANTSHTTVYRMFHGRIHKENKGGS